MRGKLPVRLQCGARGRGHYGLQRMDDATMVVRADVPPELWGCWQRNWIEFAGANGDGARDTTRDVARDTTRDVARDTTRDGARGGTRDDTSFVVWLQLPSLMADIRIVADRPDMRARGALSECSWAELLALANSESSSGFTTCTPLTLGADGVQRATAAWHTRGHGVAFQPVSAYPEPGWLEWGDDPTLMIERAPSGAYTEEWQLIAGSTEPLTYRRLAPDTELYSAGTVAVLVRDRPHPVPRAARLRELIAEAGDDRAAIEALLDCEFSFARLRGGAFVIEASTLPWREGEAISDDLR